MASYTYSLIDSGDGAMTAYFGTASMSAINASQSAEFSISYVEKNMLFNTAYLEWAGDEGDKQAEETDAGTLKHNREEFYTIPSNISPDSSEGLNKGSQEIFAWEYYSRVKEYRPGISADWYLKGTNDEGEEVDLDVWLLQETYQALPGSYDIITSPEMTIVFGAYQAPGLYWIDPPVGAYQNLGNSEPTVVMTTDENGDDSYSYTYISGELSGIRAKFASPAGSTSLSLMQAMISSSVDKIYNTSNISRFNFKKTRAEALKPREVSSIDLIKDFNRPYRGTTSG